MPTQTNASCKCRSCGDALEILREPVSRSYWNPRRTRIAAALLAEHQNTP